MVAKTFGISRIKKLLPYRYPMLLIDRLYIESDTKYIGLKNLTFNEEFFQGHFPEHPIFPGVLQIEAMEQVAEIAVGDKLEKKKGKEDIYIKSMKRVKFRRPNNPGDRMRIEIEVKSVENNEAQVSGVIKNNTGVTCQANLLMAVRPRLKENGMPELFTEFDKTEDVEMDIVKIKSIVPHRYPFLFVDYIKSVEGSHVVAIKNTTYNEPCFRAYSPDYSFLPGAVQAEIVAQAGCVSVLSRPENEGKIAYFMAIEESEFFHPVIPGDQLICEVEIPLGKSRFGRGDGFIRVGEKVVSKTSMTFALIDA